MQNNHVLVFFVLFLVKIVASQEIDSLLTQIYKRAVEQQDNRAQMGDYSYLQSVHFLKRGGDEEIEEQSRRKFRVYARPPHFIKRVLISAENYEDGTWQDVTEEEKNKERKPESQQFSLTEMFSPQTRSDYIFSMTNRSQVDGDSLLQLDVRAVKKDEDHFDGNLFFRTEDYSLVRAALIPSDTPIGIDSMSMIFDLKPVDTYWLPSEVYFEAYISFLFFFKGSIHTTITFSDYRLNQQIPAILLPEKPEDM